MTRAPTVGRYRRDISMERHRASGTGFMVASFRSGQLPRKPMKIETHPGYLGLTSDGAVLIHADWPTYAVTHGWELALIAFGRFPPNTVFVALDAGVDDIDQCFLFFVGDP